MSETCINCGREETRSQILTEQLCAFCTCEACGDEHDDYILTVALERNTRMPCYDCALESYNLNKI